VQATRKLLSNFRAIASVSGPPTALAFARAVALNLPVVVRTGNLAAADRAMKGKRWPYTLQGVRVCLDGKHFAGAREMYCRQVYFPSADFSLRANTWVVDLGANAGLFSLLAALAGCRVLAVEAQAGFVHELQALAESHGVSGRIVAEHALIGGKSGLLADARNLVGASHFGGVAPQEMLMEEMLAKHGIETVSFMKVDIEGSEFDLFRSGASWIGKIERLAVEVHPEHGDVQALVHSIASRGFDIELRDNDLKIVGALSGAGGYLYARGGKTTNAL
jgi:FkbM family methyltransferase